MQSLLHSMMDQQSQMTFTSQPSHTANCRYIFVPNTMDFGDRHAEHGEIFGVFTTKSL